MKVLITRESDKTEKFAKLLEQNGFEWFSLPMIECVPVDADVEGAYDFGVFTSLNAVKYFEGYKEKVTFGKVVAVGSATKRALGEAGISVDLMPEKYSAEGLKVLFSDIDVTGKKILMAGAETRAGDFHTWLVDNNADADIVTIYKTQFVEYEAGYVEKFLAENGVDVVTFASPSAASSFFSQIKNRLQCKIVCIGKTTYDRVKELGYDSKYPEEYTLDGMLNLI
jgi:uroporphyrinogen-III synthase